jgi:hypothetical protein
MDPFGAVRNLMNGGAVETLKRIFTGQERIGPTTPGLPQMKPTVKLPPMPTTVDSRVHPAAIAIGLAEGTRTADGGRTKDWYGHPDPLVPGRINIGTYSANAAEFSSPEQADAAWDKRLQVKAVQAAKALTSLGLKPTQLGYHRLMFNILDLEVQAPAANRLDGFMGKLGEIVKAGLSVEAIAKARADSFRNPATGKLETGFRSYSELLADQRRRAGSYDFKGKVK